MAKAKETRQKKKKGRSVQELLGIKTFTKYGLAVGKHELLFYLVSPTNISVLSRTNIEIKIRHLMMVLSAIPDIEITCTDSSECFDDNKSYLHGRLSEEQNPKVRKIIKKDIDFLDHIQMEMATARQFLFILDTMKNHPLTYDDLVVRQILQSVIVESKQKIKVIFLGGLEVEAEMEQ